MAITKAHMTEVLTKEKAYYDSIYQRKSATIERSIVVDDEEPNDKTMIWIKPDSTVSGYSRNKIVVSASEPATKDKIWIQTEGEGS